VGIEGDCGLGNWSNADEALAESEANEAVELSKLCAKAAQGKASKQINVNLFICISRVANSN
jgi:hypothetical protein